MTNETPNYYAILGVSEDASQEDIKKAFRKLSLQYHPDKSGGDPTKFKQINEAYQAIGDENSRKQYDMERKFGGRGGMPQGFPFGMGGMPGMPVDIMNAFFGGAGGGGFPFSVHTGGEGGGFPPNVRIFRNGVEVSQQQLRKPTPIIKTVEITLEQAYTGIKKPFEIERWIQEDTNMKRVEKETIYIDIPAGIDDNETIIMRNVGNVLSDDIRGDLKLFIKVINKTEFQRNGLDLIYTRKINLEEALCGFSFNMRLLDGKSICINNNDRVIRPNFEKGIVGMGMVRGGSKGNLIIRFQIEFPDKLNEEQKKLIHQAFKN